MNLQTYTLISSGFKGAANTPDTLISRGFKGSANTPDNCDIRSQFDPLNIIFSLYS